MEINKKIILIFTLLIIISGGVIFAFINFPHNKSNGYGVPNGGSKNITDLGYDNGAYGMGYKITNNSGSDQFFPTRTKAE